NLTQGYKAKLFLNLVNGSTQRLTLAQVRQRIPDNVQIVEYATLNDRLLIWLISKNTFQCSSPSIKAAELQRKVDAFLSKLKQQEPVEKDSRDLYDILVEPVRQFLDPTRSVVVIPDRYMYRLPFAALQSRKDGRYWIETAP